MRMKTLACICLVVASVISACSTFAQDSSFDSKAIQEFVQRNFDGKNTGIVIGVVDGHGSHVFSAGKLDSGTGQDMNGDTLFEIGSTTKTFTVLLLQDMVDRGQMKLDDPVTKYLPAPVKMPAHGGKEITLLDLATHTSGLPRDDDYFLHTPGPQAKVMADYSVENMYAFVSKHALRRDPGAEFEYSNIGMAVLAHAISLKAGATYEQLVTERICRPLHMDSTCVTLAPEMKSRLALGHDDSGKIVPNWEFQGYVGAGALRTTANDLLKYVAANMDLTHSSLTPLMEKTHVIRHRGAPGYGNTAMTWMDRGVSDETGMELIGHGGGTGGYESFIGFDKKNQRGVVVLANQSGGLMVEKVGWFLLEGVTLGPEIAAGASTLSKSNTVGVGLHLDFDRPTRTIRIAGVLPNSSASKAGIKAGLTVHKIGDVPTADVSLEHCACLIRGAAGTTVRLELIDAQGVTTTVELTRQKLLLPSSQPG